jgi:hypothetical protein
MSRSLAHRPNAQAVVDLYGYSDRLQIVSALNEDRRCHSLVSLLRRGIAGLRPAVAAATPVRARATDARAACGSS